ncbi:MAG: recombinase family protein, partial [Fimbriimonadales bacterium]|nr:recombinase family protein [Fimbriimonadales bacterium]
MGKQRSEERIFRLRRVAIGYCRCSTEEQAHRSSEYNTLQAQEHQIREYCLREHPDWELEIVHEVRSAKDTNRPQLQQILKRAQAGEICALIVYKFDRLARSVRDLLTLESVLQQHGVDLISLKERIDTSTPVGKLQRNILATVAEFERELIIERTRDKMRAMAARGIWVKGSPPFGYRVNRKTRRLEVVPEHAQWVRHIFHRFCELGSVGRLVRELNANPEFILMRQRAGYRDLRSDTLVKDVLRNPHYLGRIYWRDELLAENVHEPIIEPELFEKAQSLLPRNRQYRAHCSPATEEDPYHLRGVVYCYECGGALTPYWAQGNRLVHYYDHPRKTPCSRRRTNLKRVHQAVWRVIGEILRLDGFALDMLLTHEKSQSEETRREVQRLGEQIERLLVLHREGIDVPELGKQIAALQARRAELATRLKVVDVEAVRAQVESLQTLLQDWDKAYEQLTPIELREVFTLLISRVEVAADWVRVYIPLPKVRVSGGNGSGGRTRTADLPGMSRSLS